MHRGHHAGAREGLRAALHASTFDEVLAATHGDLDTAVSERGFNLSGGQRQRLCLARGVLAAQGSSLLLLDEPTRPRRPPP
ncbi:ATP-binding cassette domain-containing protein, partial [Variovorax sp. CT11-76]